MENKTKAYSLSGFVVPPDDIVLHAELNIGYIDISTLQPDSVYLKGMDRKKNMIAGLFKSDDSR